jgi:C_GCAxxG_C_C family probable redox protein
LQVLQAHYGIENEDLWRLATGLGAGIGRQGYVCGALTGGSVACGLVLGRLGNSTREDRYTLRDDTYAKVQELTRRFRERFGSIICGELTGCDFLTAEGQRRFKEQGVLQSTCLPAVRLVVETVAELRG